MVINCKQQNLKDEGNLHQLASYIMLCIVMRETNGDGIGRLVEATGATAMVNNCFSLLRLAAVLDVMYSFFASEKAVK